MTSEARCHEAPVEVSGHRGVNRLEEALKLLAAVSLMTFPDDLARGDVERGKRQGRPMASVIVLRFSGTPMARDRIGAVRSSA
jgi:hypothetical protein